MYFYSGKFANSVYMTMNILFIFLKFFIIYYNRMFVVFENSTVVVVVIPSHVIEMLPFMGKIGLLDRFPQYFTNAIFALAVAVAFMKAIMRENVF